MHIHFVPHDGLLPGAPNKKRISVPEVVSDGIRYHIHHGLTQLPGETMISVLYQAHPSRSVWPGPVICQGLDGGSRCFALDLNTEKAIFDTIE